MLFLTKRLKPNFERPKKRFFHFSERYVLCLSGTYGRGRAERREGHNVGLQQEQRPHRQPAPWPCMKLERVVPNWLLDRSRWRVQRQAYCSHLLVALRLKVSLQLCLLQGKQDGRICRHCACQPSSMTMRARHQGQYLEIILFGYGFLAHDAIGLAHSNFSCG